MAYYNSTITLGGQTLYVLSSTVRKVPGTKKQLIGKQVVRMNVLGRDLYDWEININGIIFGSNKETDRDNLLALQDNQDKNGYAYSDGSHDGTYYIEDLTFEDTGDEGNTVFRYTLRLIEKNQ